MANIADLVVSLKADIADFRSGMEQSSRSINEFQSQFARAEESARSFIQTIGEVVAAREVVGFLQESAEATRAWAEQLSTFQGLAGVSSQAAGTLAAATQLAGVSADVVTQAMARLGTTIATHPQKFQELGISIRDASGQLLPMTDIMRNTIAGLDQFKAGTDRAAAAGYLFGRGAEAWIAQLDKLGPELKSGEWDQTTELVKALGLQMDNAKATAEEWARAQGTLKLELLGVENQVGQALLPVVQELGAEILKLAKDGSFQRWGEEVGVVARAVATDIEIAAKAVDMLASAVKASADADVALYDRLVNGQRQSILKPWTPSPNGGFIPPDMRGGGTDGTVNNPAPDGTKTFNVPDPKTQELNDSIATLIANYQRQIQQNQQLVDAMNQGGDAAKKLADQFTALNRIDAIRAQALRDGITLSDAQVQSLTKLAIAEGQSADVLQRATQLHNNLAAAEKKNEEEVQKLVDSLSLLSPKQTDIADKEGLLWQAFDRGMISAQQFTDSIKQLQSQLAMPDQGAKQFASGLSTDIDSMIGKMTDFDAIIQEKDKKGGQSVFQQLSKDAADFTAELEKMLVKLLVINPLLNELGLGDQGNGKQLPTLYGSGSSVSGPPSNPVGSALSAVGGGIAKLLGFGSTAAAPPIAPAPSAVGFDSADLMNYSSGGAFGGAIAPPPTGIVPPATPSLSGISGLLEKMFGLSNPSPAALAPASVGLSDTDLMDAGFFAEGGDFDVPGSGGTDSKRVSFMATPGEHVSVQRDVASRGRSSSDDSADGGRGARGSISLTQNFSGVHSDSFQATRHQTAADALHTLRLAQRYAK